MNKILPLMLLLATVLFSSCQTDKSETIPVTILIIEKSAHIIVGQSITVTPTIIPTDASDKSLTWKSSNDEVAFVNADGVITGLKTGKATITVTAVTGNTTEECEVTVRSYDIPVTGISIIETILLPTNTPQPIVAEITPSYPTNPAVTWKSSDETIVSVTSNGIIKGNKAGRATITVTTVDGNMTDKCDVTVYVPAATGDYYYEDGTYSTELDTKKTCIGIVCIDEWLEQRMVISLDEANLIWGTESKSVYTYNVEDGTANMTKIKAIPGWEEDYPAFKWCDDKAKASGKNWYLPAHNELFGIVEPLDIINEAIAKYGQSAPLIDKTLYWSSSESSSNYAYAFILHNDYSIENLKNDTNGYVRAILIF